jgi:hypothetical protein
MQRKQRPTGEARRRTGCWPCKAKHVRCTEEQPECARCSRLHLQCQYGMRLLWQEDAVQRGICFGREGAWSKYGKTKRDVHGEEQQVVPYYVRTKADPIFLHTSYRHFEGLDGEEGEGNEEEGKGDDIEEGQAIQTLPNPTVALSHLSTLPHNDAYLLDYFIKAICPNCSLSPTDNPYLYYIAPMAFVYPPLHDAVISIAATERRLLNDKRFEKEACLYKSRALQGIQETITSGMIGWSCIATVLMLCFGDISDGCNDSWRTHLRGGLTLINQAELQTNCTESQKLRKFCRIYFVAHDIMGRTAATSSVPSTLYTWLDDDDLEEIDPLMGCSRGLLDVINRISSMNSTLDQTRCRRPLAREDLSRLEQDGAELERSLHSLRQHASASTTNPNIALVAEAKRTTALLYLYQGLDAVFQSLRETNTSLPEHITRLVDCLIAQLVPLPVTPTLLWPLFVLGNASPHNEYHRRFVLERLGDILRERNLGSVRLARRLIENRFRDCDLQMSGVIERSAGGSGRAMSLA